MPKTLRLVLIPKPGQEEKIKAFRELVRRNDLEISDILFQKVEEFLRQHNWPPGNSQTILPAFQRPGFKSRSQAFAVRVKRASDFFGHTVLDSRTLSISEKDLLELQGQWGTLSERGKQSWIQILKQVDHPIARKILEEEE